MGFFDDLQRVHDRFSKMHPDEQETYKEIIKANPLNAFVLKESAESAEAWATSLAKLFAGTVAEPLRVAAFQAARRDGPADAARHCYWSARLASKLAYNDAMRAVFTHEFHSIESGKADEKLAARMDIHNDRVGLEIGVSMKGATDQQLQDATLKALFDGQLRVINRKTGALEPTKSLAPSM